MAIHIYGIPNCDTVKKARAWLVKQNIDTIFHDYKKEGADPEQIARWISVAGLDAVLNRRGTTFRGLSDTQKRDAEDRHKAVALLVQNPSMLKRPIVEYSDGVLVGFKEDEWCATLLSSER
jgi:Spx/MgsR family transcriptional regulator